jgi:glycosyltransferase involved in cell wall biosynthesis
MGRALVSVLLPYRDAAQTVAEALESVLEQRDVELEVLPIDDGSSDESPAIVAAIAARDRRVRPCSTGGSGIVGALRLGLAHARGELIARMDADDISLPLRLSRQLAFLSSGRDLAVVGVQVELVSDVPIGEGLRRYVAWQNAVLTPADHARELFVESPLCHPTVVVRRSALDRVGGYRDAPWPEDYDVWLRMAAASLPMAKVPEVLFRWRHRSGRLTFSDPRYHEARFIEAKAHYLAPRLQADPRPLAVWGAGQTGKRVARALERHGMRAERFVDIDPKKIGRRARGALIGPPDILDPGHFIVVVAVGARGARDTVRAHLLSRGFSEPGDFICAA